MENVAAVLHGPSDVKIEPWPIEEPKEGEVQVKIHSVGICGTDVQYWKSGRVFDQPLSKPMVLGHETAGEVIKVGAGVTHLKKGDRVHLHPARPCHKCKCCQAGKGYNCQNIKLGTISHGHLRRICNHSADYAIKIPDHISMDEGALIEPFVVALYGVERGGLTPGQSCAVIGAGAIGAMVYMSAAVTGAAKICVVDVSQAKLDLLTKVGGTECKTVLADKEPKKTAAKIEEALGEKPDVVFDASCTEPGISTAIYSAAPCGNVVLVGLAPGSCTLPMQHAAINEIDIINMVRFGHCYPRGMSLIESGKVKLAPLVAARYRLDQTQEALEATAKGHTTGFKAIIDCTK